MPCKSGWAAHVTDVALLGLSVLQAEYVKTRVLALYGCHTMEQ